MRWKLRLGKFDNEILNRFWLFNQISDVLLSLLHPLETQECEPIVGEFPTFDSSPAGLEQRIKEKGVLRVSFSNKSLKDDSFPDNSFSCNSFETIVVLIRSHTAIYTPESLYLQDDLNANDCKIKANEPQALNDLAILLLKLESLEEQKNYKPCQHILPTKPSDPISSFYEGDDELLLRRQPAIPEL